MVNRREWLKLGVLSGMGAYSTVPAFGRELMSKPEPSLRIAHLTDIHLYPNSAAEAGLRACLDHLLEFTQGRVDFVLGGGDLIMDALKRKPEEIDAQWELWHRIQKDYPQLKFYHCIGNHDVTGSLPPSQAKKRALMELKLDNPYYHFKFKNWNFIVLDSTHIKPDGSWYTALLDDEQYNWLVDLLLQINKEEPILILSHIPILGATPFLDGNNAKTGDWIVPGAWMHLDAKKIITLFHKHNNVKICLSGHIHLFEQLLYNNIYYYCNGAVSGNWWQGTPYEQTENGYAYLELFEDGTHSLEYLNFKW